MRLWGWDFRMSKIFFWTFVLAILMSVWLIWENRYYPGAACLYMAGYAQAKATYWKLMEKTLRLLVGESPYDVPVQDRFAWFIRAQPKAHDAQDKFAPRPKMRLEIITYDFVLYVLKCFGLQWKIAEWKCDPVEPRLTVVEGGKNK
jgi:hypothetical protein